MVVNPLWVGGSIGVLMSGAFVYWQVGRFAAPQVPQSLFDERKALFAYTGGLFGGIVLSIPIGLFLTSLTGGSLSSTLLGLLGLVLGLELAQWLLLRSHYFGTGASGPFYALCFRVGASAIIILTLTTLYLGSGSVDAPGVGALLAESAAIVSLSAATSLQSVGGRTSSGTPTGGRLQSLLLSGVGFFFLGLAQLYGPLVGGLAAVLILVMTARLFSRLRDAVLGSIPPPGGVQRQEPPTPTSFGRTDR